MTTFTTAGWENNDFSEWGTTWTDGTGSTVHVTASPVRTGNYACECSVTGEYYTASAGCYITFGTTQPIVYERFYVRFVSGLPAADNDILLFCNTRNTNSQYQVACCVKRVSGNIYFGISHWDSGAETIYLESSATNPTTGVWYCLEFCRDVTNSKSKLWLNGTLIVDANTSHTGNATLGVCDLEWCRYSGTSAADLAFDDFVIADSYIGPAVNFEVTSVTTDVSSLIRTGAYTINTTVLWADGTDATITNYSCLLYFRDVTPSTTLGPYTCNISKLSAGSFRGSIGIDPDASFPLSYYSVKAIVSRT
jgi:hypothetical protein